MRAVLLSLAALATPLAMGACSASSETSSGSAVPATSGGSERHFTATGFDSVGLGGAGDVDIRVGPAYSIAATGAASDLDQLEVKQHGRSIGLGFKPGIHSGLGPIRWRVTMPRIVAASIGGSGTMAVDRVEGDAFEGSIGGSGDLRVAAMNVTKAQFAIGGAGTVTAAGSAKALDVSSGGAGRFLLKPLRAETATISLAGSGVAEATVTQHADVSLVGAGDVTVSGGAKCSVVNVGSGHVHCG